MRHIRLTCMLFVAFVAIFGSALVHAAAVVIVSDNGEAHTQAVNALRATLQAELEAGEVDIIDWRSLAPDNFAGSRIVVTFGSQAAVAVNDRAPVQPVLHALLPRLTYEHLPGLRRTGGRSSAIFLDQPPQRQIALVRIALPDWQRIALLQGPRSQALTDQLGQAAHERNLQVALARVDAERELFPALQAVLSEPAVLIALPDGAVFNSHTIQNVLLTAYRHRSPLLGFSPAYVRAGALLGLYSTPAQIGTQAGRTVRAFLQGGALPPPQAPAEFEVEVNHNVARSLGITLAPAGEISARLSRQERKP